MIASFTSICDAKRWIIQRKIINLSKQFFRPAGRPRVFTQPRLFPSETSSPNGSLCSMDQKPGFDIIGDVHGHAALLEKLLRKLGYVKYGKTWGHPDGRIAVFTGDLINRGPEQVETVKLVRRMVRHETAYCVAGNHEYAALCRFCGIGHVHGTDSRITFFDSAVKDPKTLQKLMKWIRTLPLWLNLGEIRVVHACWDPDAIQSILDACVREGALPTLGLYEDVLRSSGEESDAGQSLIAALDQTLKGPEVWLPKTLSYKNAEGKAVTRVRVKWWDRGITTYEAAVISDPSRLRISGKILLCSTPPCPRLSATIRFPTPGISPRLTLRSPAWTTEPEKAAPSPPTAGTGVTGCRWIKNGSRWSIRGLRPSFSHLSDICHAALSQHLSLRDRRADPDGESAFGLHFLSLAHF